MTDNRTKKLAVENIARAIVNRRNKDIERTCSIHISSFDVWDESEFITMLAESKPIIEFRIVSDGSGLDVFNYKNFRIRANPNGAQDSEVLVFDYTDFTEHGGLSNFLLGFSHASVKVSIGSFTATEPVSWIRDSLGYPSHTLTGRTLA